MSLTRLSRLSWENLLIFFNGSMCRRRRILDPELNYHQPSPPSTPHCTHAMSGQQGNLWLLLATA